MGSKRAMEPVSLDEFQPIEPGLRAHCRRVAALVHRVCRELELGGNRSSTLGAAALLHHYPAALLSSLSRSRLMADLMPLIEGARVEAPSLPANISEIVLTFLGYSSAGNPTEEVRESARILECCNIFDEEMESLPYEARSAARAIDEFVVSGGPFAKVIRTLRTLDSETLERASRRLPELSKAGLQASLLVRDETYSAADLAEFAADDSRLTAAMLKVANSPFFSPAEEIVRFDHAVASVGAEIARRVVFATAVLPLFASSSLSQLWRHSLETASWAAQLAHAAQDKNVNPADAFLGGLLHDVGIAALSHLDPEPAAEYEWWKQQGCPPTYAETVLCGSDHGAIGAELIRAAITRTTEFPEALAEAVEFHHTPELTSSALAAVLYLAELQAGSNEDLPSTVRRHLALRTLGLVEADLDNLAAAPSTATLLASAPTIYGAQAGMA